MPPGDSNLNPYSATTASYSACSARSLPPAASAPVRVASAEASGAAGCPAGPRSEAAWTAAPPRDSSATAAVTAIAAAARPKSLAAAVVFASFIANCWARLE